MQLKAVFPHGAGFVLAFEFMLSDLAEVVRSYPEATGPGAGQELLTDATQGRRFLPCQQHCASGQYHHGLGWACGWLG